MARIKIIASIRGQKGFTLLELLIALTCSALIMVALSDTLRLSLKGWKKTEHLQTHLNALRSTERTLVRLIERSTVRVISAKNAVLETNSFQGRKSSIQFISAAPGKIFTDDYLQYTIRLARQSSPNAVIVEWKTAAKSQPLEGQIELISGVKEFEIAYFGSLQPDVPEAWQDAWVNQQALPRLVRISLALESPAHSGNYQIFISPRLTNSLCANNGSSENCSISRGQK